VCPHILWHKAKLEDGLALLGIIRKGCIIMLPDEVFTVNELYSYWLDSSGRIKD